MYFRSSRELNKEHILRPISKIEVMAIFPHNSAIVLLKFESQTKSN